MKYKLIKTYPGSPPLNYIAEMQPGTNMYFYNGLQIVEIHNYPEFWQPETEWLSNLTNSPKGSLHWLNTLMGRHLRIGEAMSTEIQPDELLWSWGFDIQESSKEIMEYFKDKLK